MATNQHKSRLEDDIEFLYEHISRLPIGYDKGKLESIAFNLRGMKPLEQLKNKLIKRKQDPNSSRYSLNNFNYCRLFLLHLWQRVRSRSIIRSEVSNNSCIS